MAGQAKTAETGVQAGKESTLWRKIARVYVGTTVVAAFMISGVHPSVTLYPVPLQCLPWRSETRPMLPRVRPAKWARKWTAIWQ